MNSNKLHGNLDHQTPQSGRVLHNNWYKRNSEQNYGDHLHSHLYSNYNTPQTSRVRLNEIKPRSSSSQASDHAERSHIRFQSGPAENDSSINNSQSRIQSQSQHHGRFRSEEQPRSPGREKKRKRDDLKSASSSFSLDAVSTPHIHRDPKLSSKPIIIPIPVDNNLTQNVLRSRAETSRRIAHEQASMPKFASHVSDTSSSGSSSETESDKTVSGGELDDIGDHETTSESSCVDDNDDSDNTSTEGQGRNKSDHETSNMTTEENIQNWNGAALTEDSRADLHSESNTKVKSSKGRRSRSSKKTDTGKSLAQINTELEVSLLVSLQSLIPVHVRTHACAVLIQESRIRHGKNKTNLSLSDTVTEPLEDHLAASFRNNKNGSDSDNDNDNDIPTPTAITLKAARDLILRLSGQRLLGSVVSTTTTGFPRHHHSSSSSFLPPSGVSTTSVPSSWSTNTPTTTLEADLARIANERGKRIQDLERENSGLKAEIGLLRGLGSGSGSR